MNSAVEAAVPLFGTLTSCATGLPVVGSSQVEVMCTVHVAGGVGTGVPVTCVSSVIEMVPVGHSETPPTLPLHGDGDTLPTSPLAPVRNPVTSNTVPSTRQSRPPNLRFIASPR